MTKDWSSTSSMHLLDMIVTTRMNRTLFMEHDVRDTKYKGNINIIHDGLWVKKLERGQNNDDLWN